MQNILHKINAFCRKHGIPDSRFGRQAMNDPAFVYALREGRDVRQSTIMKLEKFMDSYKKERSDEAM